MFDSVAREHWAKELDQSTETQIQNIVLPNAPILAKRIRVFLQSQVDREHPGNDIGALFRFVPPDRYGVAEILLGTTIDKRPTDPVFRCHSGARLSFSLTVREATGRSLLVASRYHFALPASCSPAYFRIDLNPHSDECRFHEPRSHVHPGIEDLRLPYPVLGPLEILSRIFRQLEPFYRR